ncbi:MAG: hypothetical protein ACK55I_28680, partial [bacterium]
TPVAGQHVPHPGQIAQARIGLHQHIVAHRSRLVPRHRAHGRTLRVGQSHLTQIEHQRVTGPRHTPARLPHRDRRIGKDAAQRVEHERRGPLLHIDEHHVMGAHVIERDAAPLEQTTVGQPLEVVQAVAHRNHAVAGRPREDRMRGPWRASGDRTAVDPQRIDADVIAEADARVRYRRGGIAGDDVREVPQAPGRFLPQGHGHPGQHDALQVNHAAEQRAHIERPHHARGGRDGHAGRIDQRHVFRDHPPRADLAERANAQRPASTEHPVRAADE